MQIIDKAQPGGELVVLIDAVPGQHEPIILSTGMGLAGTMGFAHAEAGYESAGQMFDAFASSERYQVLAVFDLIAGRWANSQPLLALRAQDLGAFAALHYGSRQAARYASLLQSLLAAFKRLKPIG